MFSKETAKVNIGVFLFICLLLSACAGSGGAGSHLRQEPESRSGSGTIISLQPSRVAYGDPVPFRIPEGERGTSVVSPPLNVLRPRFVIPRQDDPYPQPYTPPTVIGRQDEPYPQPYTPPTVISRSEPEPRPLPRPVPVPDYIENPQVYNYCEGITNAINDAAAVNPLVINATYTVRPIITDPCNRARIPGLTRLRAAVAANVAAKISAGITPQKYGVILGLMGEHGTNVLNTATIASPRELLDIVRVGNLKADTVSELTNLKPASYGGSPIVNISQANLFAASPESAGCEPRLYSDGRREFLLTSGCSLITPEHVRAASALLVVSAGNYGPSTVKFHRDRYEDCVSRGGTNCGAIRENIIIFINGKIVINPDSSVVRLETVPEQPAHNTDALRAIHEQTGSLLLVAGQGHNGALPLTDENGLHTGYRGTNGADGGGPIIHSESNRCGMAMNFCVTAPYRILQGFTVTQIAAGRVRGGYFYGMRGTSFATPLVTGTLVNLRYVWPHLTNRQLVRLACVTAEDLGDTGIDALYGCGQFSVSAIWQPTGELVDNPESSFSLAVSAGGLTISGGAFDEPVTVTGYENNEFRRDYEVAVAASDSGTSVRIDPTVSWNSLNSILRFRQNGAASLPLADGRGSATHLFKDTFLFLKGSENSFGALGLSHKSGFSIAFERETDSFFGSAGSGSYKFGDTNKIVASFDREFQMGKTYNAGLKLAAAYGKMEPDISLVNSASGGAQTAQLSIGRKKNNFETRVEMSYSTGLKGEISVQNTNYRLRPISEKAIMLKMRLAI